MKKLILNRLLPLILISLGCLQWHQSFAQINNCNDPTLIDPNVVCTTVYDPVCGCDGVTYSNACVARYQHGVVYFTPGPCNSNCQANFTYTIDSTGYRVQFHNLSTPPVITPTMYSAYWDFGDGTTSNQFSPFHVYPQPGRYNVCLTITVQISPSGPTCTSTFCDTVIIRDPRPCIDSSLINPHIICPHIWDPVCGCDSVTYANACYAKNYHGVTHWRPGPCHTVDTCNAFFTWHVGIYGPEIFFTDRSSSNVNHWEWDFGDGNTSNLQDPSHVYDTAGTYVVCLTASVIDPNGNVRCRDVYCETITVSGCYDPSVIDSTRPCLTIYDPVCGCDSVTYPNSCVAYYHHGITWWRPGPCGGSNVCQAKFTYRVEYPGPEYHFIDQSGNNTISWHWNFGDGTTSTDRNPVHHFPHAGTYRVCLTITGTVGGAVCIDTYCDTVVVPGCIDSSLINPTILCYNLYDPVCGCDSVTYYNDCVALHHHGVTNWRPGPCPQPVCKADFIVAYPSITNEVYFFDNSTGPYTNVLWDFGDGTTSTDRNPVHAYDTTGWYEVCLTIWGPSLTCFDRYCDSVFAIGCVDPSLIDPTQVCPLVYDPVCGCDGRTYNNACEATYWHGITYYTHGPCPGSGYCDSYGRDNHIAWIERVGPVRSGDNHGYYYQDLCHRTLRAGKTYVIPVAGRFTILPAPAKPHWRLWADFNHDYDFDDPGELVWQAFGGLRHYAVVTIPNYACAGCTRFRIQLSTDWTDACGPYAIGETEDYDINVLGTHLCRQSNAPNAKMEGEGEPFAEEYTGIDVMLFPNPAQDMVNVQLQSAGDADRVEVTVYDLSGRAIMTRTVDGVEAGTVVIQLETGNLANGIYQVEVRTDRGFGKTEKLVIAR